MDKISSSAVGNYNRKQVFNLIYREKRISRQQIAEELGLSLPTVTQNLKYLEEGKLIEKNGLFQSTGGRKSVAYTCVSNAQIAIGLHIAKRFVRIVAVDIYGTVFRRDQIEIEYIHRREYYQAIGSFVKGFIKSLNVSSKRVLGVGIAIMALLSLDHQAVTKSVLLGESAATLADFKEFIDYPCQLFRVGEAAANTELWRSPHITDAQYICLDRRLNGILIMNGKIHTGKEHIGGLVEHLTLHPNGRPCYCGKRGCFTEYCSGELLFDEQGEEEFFRRLRGGDREAGKRWEEYLNDLALAIGSLYAILDCDIILGGTVGLYMNESDRLQLQQLVRRDSLYAPVSDFISLGYKDEDVTACGAAIPYIAEFIANI